MSETLEEALARVAKENLVRHEEPICNGQCGHDNPHRHGFPCHMHCECKGICHPTCPAYEKDE